MVIIYVTGFVKSTVPIASTSYIRDWICRSYTRTHPAISTLYYQAFIHEAKFQQNKHARSYASCKIGDSFCKSSQNLATIV